ncbi:MAG: YigZ family protein [Thermoflavifilum sp.]|nr:YigZ family protein [Thermoflavifilum sp.]MCL6513729.1 YigZ family protein [Alicyclobacillus sp.]
MMEHASDDLLFPAAPCVVEQTIRRSRFIGHVVPVFSTQEAERELELIRARHAQATHNCYAWRVGLEVPTERYSDDGEPSGTAGRPILDALRHRGVTQCLVVVTRYFGGILLGAGGLVHAYSGTTVQALDAASLLRCQRLRRLHVRCAYDAYGKIEHTLSTLGVAVGERNFGVDVRLVAWPKAAEAGRVMDMLREITAGQAEVTCGEEIVMGVDEDGKPVTPAVRAFDEDRA